jgi:uncharacterized protein (DUF302 family)
VDRENRPTYLKGINMNKQDLGFEIHLNLPHDQAVENVTAALKTEGFGVLTRIDMRATMKEKLGVDFRPYTILGACNPPLAYRALSADSLTGLLLPCNVTVEAAIEGGSVVQITDPEVMLTVGALGENETLRQISKEAQAKLIRVAEILVQLGATA